MVDTVPLVGDSGLGLFTCPVELGVSFGLQEKDDGSYQSLTTSIPPEKLEHITHRLSQSEKLLLYIHSRLPLEDFVNKIQVKFWNSKGKILKDSVSVTNQHIEGSLTLEVYESKPVSSGSLKSKNFYLVAKFPDGEVKKLLEEKTDEVGSPFDKYKNIVTQAWESLPPTVDHKPDSKVVELRHRIWDRKEYLPPGKILARYGYSPHVYGVFTTKFKHYGVLVGGGRVVEVTGPEDSNAISLSTFEDFASKSAYLFVVDITDQDYPGTATRALVLHEQQQKYELFEYDIATKNCESFVQYCVFGTLKGAKTQNSSFITSVLTSLGQPAIRALISALQGFGFWPSCLRFALVVAESGVALVFHGIGLLADFAMFAFALADLGYAIYKNMAAYQGKWTSCDLWAVIQRLAGPRIPELLVATAGLVVGVIGITVTVTTGVGGIPFLITSIILGIVWAICRLERNLTSSVWDYLYRVVNAPAKVTDQRTGSTPTGSAKPISAMEKAITGTVHNIQHYICWRISDDCKELSRSWKFIEDNFIDGEAICTGKAEELVIERIESNRRLIEKLRAAPTLDEQLLEELGSYDEWLEELKIEFQSIRKLYEYKNSTSLITQFDLSE